MKYSTTKKQKQKSKRSYHIQTQQPTATELSVEALMEITFNPNSTCVSSKRNNRKRKIAQTFPQVDADDEEISINPSYLDDLVESGHIALQQGTSPSSSSDNSTATLNGNATLTTTDDTSSFDAFNQIVERRKQKALVHKNKSKKSKKRKKQKRVSARDRIKASLAAANTGSTSPDSASLSSIATTIVTTLTTSASNEIDTLRARVITLEKEAKVKDNTIRVLQKRVTELEQTQMVSHSSKIKKKSKPTSSSSSSSSTVTASTTNSMKNASSSLLNAKSRLKKSTHKLTPRKRSKLRQQQKQQENRKSGGGIFGSLLQSKMLARRRKMNNQHSPAVVEWD